MKTIFGGIILASLVLLGAQGGMGPGPGTPHSSGGSPPAIVTGAAHQCGYSGSSTLACTVTGATGGNFLLVIYAPNNRSTSVTDSVNTASSPVCDSGLSICQAYVPNVTAGSHTVTVNGVAFTNAMFVQEYSGVATSSSFGNTQTYSNSFSPMSTGTLTTGTSGSFTSVACFNNDTAALTGLSATNSFVLNQNIFDGYSTIVTLDNVAVLNGASGSSISSIISYTGSGNWGCLSIEVRP